MTNTRSTASLFQAFSLPNQDLSKLSFCASEPAKLGQWLESLPSTRTTETSVIFYKVLPEICRLTISPEKRIRLLETVYPHVHQCIEGAMHKLLRQPLLLSSQMMKLAVITQALQRHLNEGYMVALKDLTQTSKNTGDQSLSALCLYRVISGLGLLLLRSYQFYTPQPPTGIWLKLHAFYQFAIEQQLEKMAIKDSLLKSQQAMAISTSYKRSLLLACSSPLQLRQVDMIHVFQAFEQCASMVHLKPAKEDDRQSLYWVSLKHDKSPFYNHHLRGEPGKGIYAINLESLIATLKSTGESNNNRQSSLHLPIPYSNVVVTHLLRCWGKTNSRLMERQSSTEPLEICVGLTALHNQLLGDDRFESLTHNSLQKGLEEGNLLGNPNDDWQLEEKLEAPISQANTSETLLTVNTLNSSASGYCLIWENEVPDKVRVGELLGLRQPKQLGWHIGIICWAQRHKDKVYTGVRLLSQKATAYAASTVLSDGSKSPYFRALLLTSASRGESHSVITPSIPFAVDQTVVLRRFEEKISAYLTDLLITSATVSQFSYRLVNESQKSI